MKSRNFLFWCDDCKMFVDEKHRCQQWQTVFVIPIDAYYEIRDGKQQAEPPKEAE